MQVWLTNTAKEIIRTISCYVLNDIMLLQILLTTGYLKELCVSVSNLRKECSKNNTLSVNYIMFNIKCDETIFRFLGSNGARV
jgi:hypothetical protein